MDDTLIGWGRDSGVGAGVSVGSGVGVKVGLVVSLSESCSSDSSQVSKDSLAELRPTISVITVIIKIIYLILHPAFFLIIGYQTYNPVATVEYLASLTKHVDLFLKAVYQYCTPIGLLDGKRTTPLPSGFKMDG